MNKKWMLKKSVLAVGLALGALPYVHAEEAKQEVKKVEVTGSRIKRIDAETSSPVTILTRDDIERSGANTVQQVLANLTSNSNDAISDLGGANSWASGSTGVSLRNLGVNSTLVLMNGRRLPAFGFADGLQSNFTNIDAMPSSVIDRVEILRDGASAIYGSDAIAGVINIITRKDFQGVSVRGTAQQSLKAHFLDREHKASITGGLGSLDNDGYNVLAHLEYFHRGNYSDRQVRPHLPDWFIQMNPARDALSAGSFPGTYTGRYPANYRDPALAGRSITAAAPGCAPENIVGTQCMYDYWKDSDARPPADRLTFYSAARLKLGGGRQAYAEASGSSLRNDYHTAIPRSNPGFTSTWYNWNKQSLQSFTDPLLPANHPNNPYGFPIGLNYRFVDYPDMFKNVGASTQYRLLAGIEGTDFGWDWDAAIGNMASFASQKQHLYRDRYAYHDAIVSGEYKFGQQNPRELLERMFPEMGSRGAYRQAFFDFKASREIGKLDGGPLQMALGFDFRREEFEHASSDNIQQARIVGFSAVSIAGARNLAAGYVELSAPFTKQLEANFAVRGDRAIGQTGAVVPKVGMKYKLTDSFMLRGTAAEGFRAPSLPETGNGGASWFNNRQIDPKRCDTAIEMQKILNTGNSVDKTDAITAYNLGCSVSFPSAITPNPDLKPERTKSFTAGFVLEPSKEIAVTLDYYSIKRRDEIRVKDVSRTLALEDSLAGIVERDSITPEDIRLAERVKELSGRDIKFATGPIRTIGLQYENLGRTKVSGVDAEIKTRWNLGDAGKLKVDLEMTYQIEYRTWDSYKNDYSENWIGTRGTPHFRAFLKPSWERGVWATGAKVNYYGGTRLAWGEDDTVGSLAGCAKRGISEERCSVDGDTTVDVWLKYYGWKGTTLQANLYNAFDRRDVEVLVPGQTYLPLRGRTLMLSLEHKF